MPTSPASKPLDEDEDSPALIEGDPSKPISRDRLNTAVRATSVNQPTPNEEQPQEQPDQAPEPKIIGTTGGEVPTFESDRPHQPIKWSADPAERQNQVQQEIARRRQVQGEAEHPFMPSSWAPDVASNNTPRDDREVEQTAENQFQFQRQQEVAKRRQDIAQSRADLANYNSQQLAKFTANGQRHYVDPASGKVTPVLDEQGRPQFTPTKWELTQHPKTGQPALMMRDRFGQRQFKEPQVVAPLDPTDDNMYHQLPDGTLSDKPAGKISDLAQSPNYRIAKVALAAQKRNIHAKHQEALAGSKALLDDATASLNDVRTQRDDLDSQIADTEKLFATTTDQTKLDALTATLQQQNEQRDALNERIKPNGDLGNMVSRNRAAYVAARAAQAVDTYRAQEAEIAAAVKARGGKLEDDPAYKDNLRNIQINEQLKNSAEAELQKTTALQPKGEPNQSPVDAALSSAEPYIRAGKGVKMIGSVPIQEFSNEFGDGRGPVNPQSVLKLYDRSKEIDGLLKNDSTTKLTPVVLSHLQQEKDYIDTLAKQRFARLPQDQQKQITEITRDPTLGEKRVAMETGFLRGVGNTLAEGGKGVTSFFSRRLINPTVVNPDDNLITRSIDKAQKLMNDNLVVGGVTPEVQQKLRDSFVTGTAPETAGQIYALFAPSGAASKIGKAAGMSEEALGFINRYGTAATAAATGSNSMREQAIKVLKPKLDAGQITQDDYQKAVGMSELAGGAIGAAAFVPVSRMLNRVSGLPAGQTLITSLLDRAAKGGKVSAMKWLAGNAGKQAVTNAVSEGVEMGGIGWAQNVANDLAAKTIFDPNRQVSFKDASDSGASMGVLAALTSAFTHALPAVANKLGKGPGGTPEEPGATAPKAPTPPAGEPTPESTKPAEPNTPTKPAKIPAEHKEVLDRLADAAERAHTGTPEEQASANAELERILAEGAPKSEPVAEANVEQKSTEPAKTEKPTKIDMNDEAAIEAAAEKQKQNKTPNEQEITPKLSDISIPEGHIQVEIERPNGSRYRAIMNGYVENGKGDLIPHIGRQSGGGWSHSSLKDGEKIIGGNPSPDLWQRDATGRIELKNKPNETESPARAPEVLSKLPEGTEIKYLGKSHSVIEGMGDKIDHWSIKLPGETQSEKLTAEALAKRGYLPPEELTTKKEKQSNATITGQEPKENIVQHQGATSGTAVQENVGKVRQRKGRQAGNSNRAVEGTREQQQPRSVGEPELGSQGTEAGDTGVGGGQVAKEESAPAIPEETPVAAKKPKKENLPETTAPVEEKPKAVQPPAGEILPSQMKREDRIAELKAGGITTIKGKSLEDATAGETMVALSRLRASKLSNEPIAEKAKPDIIDRLKAMKKDTAGKLYSAPEGLYDAAHNAAIDVAILAVKAGRKLNDVIKLALDRFKAKFPDYRQEHLDQVENSIRETLMKQEKRAQGEKMAKTESAALKDKGVLDEIQRIFAPQTRGEAARETAGALREHGAELAQRADRAAAALDTASKHLASLPEAARWDFVDAIEKGEKQSNPELQQFADTMRSILDKKREEVQALGKGALDKFIEDYFPHIWKNPDQVINAFQEAGAKKPIEGGKSFLKKRTIPTTKEGLALGLEPASKNPVDLLLLKAHEMDKFITAHNTMNELKSKGFVKLVRAGDTPPPGYAKINDKIATIYGPKEGAVGLPEAAKEAGVKQEDVKVYGRRIMGEYYAPESVATVINNYLSPGLRGSPSFRAYLTMANSMNQLQLGLSAFHLGFTSIDAATSRLAVGLEDVMNGKLVRGLGNIASAMHPLSPITIGIENAVKGNKVLQEWYKPGSQGAEMTKIVDGLKAAGGRANMDRFYQTEISKKMMDNFREGGAFNYAKGTLRAPFALIEKAAKPIMEYIVPRQKLGVFADIARRELEKLGPNASREDVRLAMGKAWDSVDNRMGQLVYDNLFWKKAAKDLGAASVRSLGWNLGTLRELGGGAVDTAVQSGKLLSGKKAEFTHRMAYLAALPVMTGMLGATTQYLLTGKGPDELRDYFFPKTGEKDAQGRDIRLTIPSYMKDVYHYGHDTVGTIAGKVHPAISLVRNMLNNKDYFDRPIRNADDPFIKQLWDTAKYTAQQMSPIGITQAVQAASNSQRPAETAANFVGVTQAPKWLSMSKAEQLAQKLNSAHQGSGSVETAGAQKQYTKKNDILDRLRNGSQADKFAAQRDLQEMVASGELPANSARHIVSNSKHAYLVNQLTHLDANETLRVYRAATPEERAQIKDQVASKITRSQLMKTDKSEMMREFSSLSTSKR